jgi:hypothetical protein
VAQNPVQSIPRNYAQIANNVQPTFDFQIDAGAYGLTYTGSAGTITLQRMVLDPTLGAEYVTVFTTPTLTAAGGYQELHLPAGQYHLLLNTTTAASALFERIGPFAGR